jgi:hypothetical protein
METLLTEKDQIIHLFCSFLNSIGITTIEKEFEGASFLPGLKIENGKLLINREQLLYPGDILHEAGHIAVTVAADREQLKDNVIENNTAKAGDEMAVMLWTYAACRHLKIDPAIVFHKDGYKGDADWLLANYKEKKYIGLPLLVWMGLANDQNNKDGFPTMVKWLRD